jgi:hypothetical protein
MIDQKFESPFAVRPGKDFTWKNITYKVAQKVRPTGDSLHMHLHHSWLREYPVLSSVALDDCFLFFLFFFCVLLRATTK